MADAAGRKPWEGNDGSRGGYVSPRVKAAVRQRDRHCVLRHPGCTGAIDEFHHPDGLAASGTRRKSVLSAKPLVGVCRHCHGIDTRKQISAGRNRWKRQPECHPGLK